MDDITSQAVAFILGTFCALIALFIVGTLATYIFVPSLRQAIRDDIIGRK